MLSQLHNMITSIESHVAYLLRQEESQSQSEKMHNVNEPLSSAYDIKNTIQHKIIFTWKKTETGQAFFSNV